MPNIKKLTFPYSLTGLTTVCIVMKQIATGYFLDHADGAYKAVPTNPYIPLPELAVPEQGTYERNEDRTIWVDGLYRGLVYPDATGTKAPIGSEEMYILDDTEVVIDPQIIRDAMKLAPTAGTPADGSIDKHLDDIESKTSTLQTILTGSIAQGAVQRRVVLKDTKVIETIRGDVWPIPFTLGAEESWETKKIYFIAKKEKTDANSTAIVNREITVTDAAKRVGNITLTEEENAVVGKYYCELEVRDNDDTNPRTDYQGILKITQDVRQ